MIEAAYVNEHHAESQQPISEKTLYGMGFAQVPPSANSLGSAVAGLSAYPKHLVERVAPEPTVDISAGICLLGDVRRMPSV